MKSNQEIIKKQEEESLLEKLMRKIILEDKTIERACEECKVPIESVVTLYPILWEVTEKLEKKQSEICELIDKFFTIENFKKEMGMGFDDEGIYPLSKNDWKQFKESLKSAIRGDK